MWYIAAMSTRFQKEERERLLAQNPLLREAFEAGRKEEHRLFLRTAFLVRVGRAPTPTEQEALAERVQKVGAEQVLRAMLAKYGDALTTWLLPPKTPSAEEDHEKDSRYQRAFERGEARGRRDVIVRLLIRWMGALDQAVQERIQATSDLGTLKSWWLEAIYLNDAEGARRLAEKIRSAPLP
jgi:hypothetical protein